MAGFDVQRLPPDLCPGPALGARIANGLGNRHDLSPIEFLDHTSTSTVTI